MLTSTIYLFRFINQILLRYLWWRRLLLPLSWSVFVVRKLHHVQHSQSLSLLHEWSPLLRWQLAPSLAKIFRYSRVVKIRTRADQLLSLNLTPDHEGVQWSLDMWSTRLLLLKKFHCWLFLKIVFWRQVQIFHLHITIQFAFKAYFWTAHYRV